jgi:hypothetical protein
MYPCAGMAVVSYVRCGTLWVSTGLIIQLAISLLQEMKLCYTKAIAVEMIHVV